MSAFESHRRAVAFGDAEVRQKPLFPGFRVSTDVFKFRIEIGGGDVGQKPLLIARYGRRSISTRPGIGSSGLNTASVLQVLKERK